MAKKRVSGSPDLAAELADDPDEAPILMEAADDLELFQGNTFIRRGRGRPPTGKAKELISVRLSRDVVAKLRGAGPGWQSQVDVLLRRALGLDAGADVKKGGHGVAGAPSFGQMLMSAPLEPGDVSRLEGGFRDPDL